MSLCVRTEPSVRMSLCVRTEPSARTEPLRACELSLFAPSEGGPLSMAIDTSVGPSPPGLRSGLVERLLGGVSTAPGTWGGYGAL